MGWIIATIVLTIIVTVLGFALFNLIKKNETLEDFIAKQSEAIKTCDQRLKQIDKYVVFPLPFYKKYRLGLDAFRSAGKLTPEAYASIIRHSKIGINLYS